MIESRPTIEAADGHSVAAIHLKTGAESLVILSHGITSEKNEDGIYSRLAETKLAAHFDSIRFDFRGHGESALSSRESTISGEILDLMAVFGWARRQQYRRVFHLATSFGGSITLLAAQCFDLSFLSAVAFWSPVIDYDRTFIQAAFRRRQRPSDPARASVRIPRGARDGPGPNANSAGNARRAYRDTCAWRRRFGGSAWPCARVCATQFRCATPRRSGRRPRIRQCFGGRL